MDILHLLKEAESQGFDAALIGLLVLVLSWEALMPNPWWCIMGALLDVGILFALLWAHWPSATVVGS